TLDTKAGGPSAELTPFFDGRTLYGRVSRYKLDEYLQLFDFPSPNLSAEKRFTTTVPLQRLFFMNSDFMQQQGELLARRVASEPNNPARVQKVYRLIFGRAPTDSELRAGLDYLATEPMKEYEERKNTKNTKDTKNGKEKETPRVKDTNDEDKEMVGDSMM